MDFAGFLATIVAWYRAQRVGLDHQVFAALRSAQETSLEKWERLKFRYNCFLAGKSVRLLFISAAVELLAAVAIWSMAYVVTNGEPVYPTALLIAVAILWLAKVAYGVYQIPAIPQFKMDNGNIVYHPEDHDLAGLPKLDDAKKNKLKRHSFLLTFALTVASMSLAGMATVWMGILNGETETVHAVQTTWTYTLGNIWLIIAGGVYGIATLHVAFLGVSILMGAYAKSVSVLEYASSLAGEQALVVLPGITTENVRQRFQGFNFLDQERHQAMVLKALLNVKIGYMQWWLPITIFSIPIFALGFAGYVAMRGITDYMHERKGGEIEVENDRYKTTKLYRWLMPLLVVVAILFRLNDEWRVGLVGVLMHTNLFVGQVLSGEPLFRVTPGKHWWLPPTLVAITIATWKVAGSEWKTWKWWKKAIALLPGIAGVGLIIAMASGVKEIGLPKTNARLEKSVDGVPIVVNAPTALPNVAAPTVAPTELIAMARNDGQVVLLWKEGSEDENGFAIQRRTSRTTFADIGSVGPNTADFLDTDAQPDTTYFYRILAVNEGGESPPSNTASVTTPEAAQTVQKTEQEEQKKDVVATTSESIPKQQTRVRPSGCTPKRIAFYRKHHGGTDPPQCR